MQKWVYSTIAAVFMAIAAFMMYAEYSQAQTPVGNVREFVTTFTPVATAAAIGTSQQTITLTPLTTFDLVYVNGPVPTALCPMTGFRVSAANTLQLDFTTLTAAACTPAAGTYSIIAIK